MTGNLLKYIAALGTLLLSFSANAQQADEERVGRSAAAQLLGAARLVDSSVVQTYVNTVGQSIAQYSGANYTWHFGVVASDSINAFAMPGGYILLTAGLVRLLQSEDDLAYVLAHEIAHVVRRHHYQVIQRQRLAEQASKNLQEVSKEDEMAKLSLASGQIYARGLDKTAEYESDRLGAEFMTKAGYDPANSLGVLEQLIHFKGNDPRTELLFSTHPNPTERFSALVEAGIDKLPRPAVKTNANREKRFKLFRDAV
jgi:predicted Zn-dependent protease